MCAGPACLAGPVSDWPSKDHDDSGDDGAPNGPRAPTAAPPGSTGGVSAAPESDFTSADAGRADEQLDGGVVDASDGGTAKSCNEIDDAGHCTAM